MKKLLTLMAMLTIGISTNFAQAQTKTQKVETTSKTHTKADGTPDKRYKQSTTTATTAQSSKKEEAQAKSMKETKSTATSTTTAGPTKKDGTPDMRYKSNKTTTAKKVTPKG